MIDKKVLFAVIFCLLFRLNNANNITTTVDMTTTNAPQLSNNYSRIITIIYFSLYLLILFLIGIVVKSKSGLKLCSKKYFRALWIQKGIYFAILIHVYDTATDIGVLIEWYFLMENERKGFNYENIDMKVFFWCGIASIILYKIWIMRIILCTNAGKNYNPIIMIILTLFELSLFVFVYDSFKNIQPKMNKYYENEKKRKDWKSNTKDQINMEIELQAQANANNNDNKIDNKSSQEQTEGKSVENLDDIEISKGQFLIQLFEGIFESMPQVLLQSIFLLRSYNTPLSQDSNILLIVASLIASILSISTKMISQDGNLLSRDGILIAKNNGCKIKLICIDNKCSCNGNNLYFIRVFWRIFTILNRFIILSLIWTVLGGISFSIYIGISILYNIILMWYNLKDVGDGMRDKSFRKSVFLTGISNVLVVFAYSPRWILIIKTRCIDHLIILTLTLLFTLTNIECNICVNICFRSLNNVNNNCDINWERNDLLLTYIISSWVVYIMDILFTIIIVKFKPFHF